MQKLARNCKTEDKSPHIFCISLLMFISKHQKGVAYATPLFVTQCEILISLISPHYRTRNSISNSIILYIFPCVMPSFRIRTNITVGPTICFNINTSEQNIRSYACHTNRDHYLRKICAILKCTVSYTCYGA